MPKSQLPVQQLVILSICRLSEPIVFTSILPYLPELIEYVGVPKPEVAKWAGIASAVASVTQATMAVPWGTLSDRIGRKPVIISGQIFTMLLSIMLGMSSSLSMVLVSRALIGFMNGNVGIIRTMVAEIVPQRELQPRAFSIMPMVWTIGSIFGPAFGGALARPAEKHPNLFGGSEFLKRYPFALPNLVSACFFVVGITTGILFLKETLATKRDRYDPGLVLGQTLIEPCTSRRKRELGSLKLENEDRDEEETPLLSEDRPISTKPKKLKKPVAGTKWSQILTPQSILVLISYTLVSGLGMAFDSVFPVFLHWPVQDLKNNPDVKLPFKFTSGFGIDAQVIGLFYTISGIAGMFIQFLFFPPIVQRFGVLRCFRVSALSMPIIFFLTPFTALVPEPFRIPSVLLILFAKLGSIIFSIPCCTILLTNSASSVTVLGTLNGVATSVSALGRAAGPALIGTVFSWGVERGYVIIPWWLLSALTLTSVIPAIWIVEQDGPHREVEEEEEEEEEEEVQRENGSVGTYGAVDASTEANRR